MEPALQTTIGVAVNSTLGVANVTALELNAISATSSCISSYGCGFEMAGTDPDSSTGRRRTLPPIVTIAQLQLVD